MFDGKEGCQEVGVIGVKDVRGVDEQGAEIKQAEASEKEERRQAAAHGDRFLDWNQSGLWLFKDSMRFASPDF
jgi:hypothetical protein